MWPFRCPYKMFRKEILLDAADLDQKGNLSKLCSVTFDIFV